MGPVFSFKLRPRKWDKRYYDVFLTRNLVDMYKVMETTKRGRGERKLKRNYYGACAWYPKNFRAEAPENCIGSIFLADTHGGVGTVTHEITHAALFYLMLERGLKRPSDELLCTIVVDMSSQYWTEHARIVKRQEKMNKIIDIVRRT